MTWPCTYVGSSIVISDQFSPNNVYVPKPAGVQEGDVLRAILFATNAGGVASFSMIGGTSWDRDVITAGGYVSPYGCRKVAGDAEPDYYTARAARGSVFAIGLIAYRNVNVPHPLIGPGEVYAGRLITSTYAGGTYENSSKVVSVGWGWWPASLLGNPDTIIFKRYVVMSFAFFGNGTAVNNPVGLTIRNQVSNALGSAAWLDGRWTRDVNTSMYYDSSKYTYEQETVSPVIATSGTIMPDDYEWDAPAEHFAGKGRKIFFSAGDD